MVEHNMSQFVCFVFYFLFFIHIVQVEVISYLAIPIFESLCINGAPQLWLPVMKRSLWLCSVRLEFFPLFVSKPTLVNIHPLTLDVVICFPFAHNRIL